MGPGIHRFTCPEILLQVSPRLMFALLDRHREPLSSCGWVMPEREHAIDVEALAKVLQSGCDLIPHDLLDDLWSVRELQDAVEAVQHAVISTGLPGTELLAMSVEDMIVWLCLNAREALQKLLAERASSRPRTYTTYLAGHSAELFCHGCSDTKCRAIGVSLDNALRDKHRGVRVSENVFQKASCLELVYGFGGSLSRVASADMATIGSVTYRPLEHVVIRIDRSMQSLSISNQPSWLMTALRRAVGAAYFADADHFDDGRPVYTLAPLLRNGASSLVCTDIGEMRKVTLVELRYARPGTSGHTITHKAADLRHVLADLSHEGVKAGHLLQAKVKVLRRGESRSRTVEIREGNKASYCRNDDQLFVESFLIARGFMVGKQHAGRKSA